MHRLHVGCWSQHQPDLMAKRVDNEIWQWIEARKMTHGLLKETMLRPQWIAFLVAAASLIACTTETPSNVPAIEKNSELTQGNIQLNLVVGTTTKAEVLETFGAPNVTTRDGSGRETWSYQRAGQVGRSSSQSTYGTVIFFGGETSSSGFESSSRMVTLIIKFDENDVVSDFRSRTSNF